MEVIGQDDPKVHLLMAFLNEIGKRDLTLQGDCESTIIKVLELTAERFNFRGGEKARSVRVRTTSGYSSNSQGSIERVVRLVRDQIRVMFGAICHKYDMVFPHDTRWLGWLARHACWLINRVIKNSPKNALGLRIFLI